MENKDLTTVITNKREKVNVIDSREVAEMLGKEHSYVLEMIQGRKGKLGIIPVLTNANLAVVNYFIESNYKDAKGEERKCYLVTKMGCEMLGNKQQGEKGILFTAKYVERFNQMEEELKKISREDELLLTIAKSNDPVERMNATKEYTDIKMLPLENEIKHKEGIITSLTEGIELASMQQRINDIVRYGNGKERTPEYFQKRYKLLYSEFEKKYHINIRVRIENARAKKLITKKVTYMEYICNVLGMTTQLYELACTIFEADAEAVKNKLFKSIEK